MRIYVNKNAASYHEEEILIHAPVELVYRILASIENWKNWQSDVSESIVFDKIDAGTRFDWKAGGFRIKSEIHTATAPLEFGWTGKMLWIKAIHNWTFQPDGNSTRVTVKESLEGFLAGMLQKSLADGMKKNLIELRTEAEKYSK